MSILAFIVMSSLGYLIFNSDQSLQGYFIGLLSSCLGILLPQPSMNLRENSTGGGSTGSAGDV